MKTHFPVALTFLFLAPCVLGHGYVSVLDVEGTSYASFNGDEPTEDGQATQPSVIRRISTIDPVKGASNPFLNCGQNATAAALVAPTQAGDALALHWEAGGGQGVSSLCSSLGVPIYNFLFYSVASQYRSADVLPCELRLRAMQPI